MTLRRLMIPLMLSLALLASGCGSKTTTPSSTAAQPGATVSTATSAAPSAGTDASGCPTSNATNFAKTKFVAHTGLAFGAFHRYIYKPFKAGTFSSGGLKTKALAFGKAGAAALFVKREVRLAIVDVKASPILCKTLAAPLQSLSDTIGAAVTKARGGDTSGITDAEKQLTSIKDNATKGGTPITEDPNPNIG